MSRKQIVALAAECLFNRPCKVSYSKQANARYNAAMYVWGNMVKGIADVCAANNGQFDRERFYTAAGYDPAVQPTFLQAVA